MIKIKVHPLTSDPTKAWNKLTKTSWLNSVLGKMGFAKTRCDQELQVKDCDLE